jgi:hypothetical protein
MKCDFAIHTAMDYIPLSDNAARQVVDSNTLFEEYHRVRTEARKYEGGMYWKRQGAYEYLTKTTPDNRQTRIAPDYPRQSRSTATSTRASATRKPG